MRSTGLARRKLSEKRAAEKERKRRQLGRSTNVQGNLLPPLPAPDKHNKIQRQNRILTLAAPGQGHDTDARCWRRVLLFYVLQRIDRESVPFAHQSDLDTGQF